ncbi:hypothetical protein PAAG_05681 [Paracoccidioides lutzii Pb01]|uniref:Uncharacterized protein n=1 Tax=Paracoccidioides lutzii (strain ATCC MYA-826 / Pb01) TaxID=502779 RepID=C1H4I8_PARBA|nr:hypothetical protein PAAG_05681 [Paracoccidioides lutzii Pb01]EEH34632.2 hypothetical protein PAAG_05681 [Paracoccidioides lutzii Pb01]
MREEGRDKKATSQQRQRTGNKAMKAGELLNGGWMKWKLDKLGKKEKSGGGGGGGGDDDDDGVVVGRDQTLGRKISILTYESNQPAIDLALFAPQVPNFNHPPWRSMKRLYSLKF